MKIKRILLLALCFALPVFSWYFFNNSAVIKIIQANFRRTDVLVAFCVSSALLIGAHTLRAYKTKLLTDQVKNTSWRTHTRALFIGYLFNILLPIRLGEFIRAYVLGKSVRMSATFMFGLVLLERAVDGIALGLLTVVLLFTTNAFPSSGLRSVILTASLGLLLASSLVIILLVLPKRQPARLLLLIHRVTSIFNDEVRDLLRFKTWSLMYGLERTLIRKQLRRYLLLSAVMWVTYIAAVVPLLSVFIQTSSSTQITTTSTVSYLGISAPTGPAYIGSYEKFVDQFINVQSDISTYRTALIFAWLFQIIPAFLVGMIFVLRTQETTRSPAASRSLQAIDDKLLRDVDVSRDLGSFLDAFFTNNSLSRIMHRLEVDKQSKLIHYFKGGSSAITALVHENNQFIVRKITPIQFKHKLYSQYIWLNDKAKLKKVVNVLSDETTDDYYKIDLEFNKEYTPFFDYIHSMPLKKSQQILTDIFVYLNKHIYRPQPEKYRPADLKAYIEDRCLAKIRQAAEVNDEIRGLLTHDKLVINGQEYENIPQIIDKIRRDKSLFRLLATYRKCSIHGDTTIDNILTTKKTDDFLLIDPTDNENEISGPVFDFGRMSQSLVYGYEFLNRDEQAVTVVENIVNFEYSVSSKYDKLAEHLSTLRQTHLTKTEQQAVLFHSAVLYSRMLTHRVVLNPGNAAKYYAVSVIAFNEFFDSVNHA